MLKYFTIKSKKTFLVAVILFCIISVFLMVRIGVFNTIVPLDTYDNDDVRYLHSAKTLLETGKLTYFNPEKSTVYIMPGIVVALVPFVAVFGEVGAVFAFKIFQILLQIIGLYLIGLISQKLFGDKISKFSMIVLSVYYSWCIMINYLYTEVIFTILLLLLIYLTLIAFDENKIKFYAWAGFVWALAVLVRSTIAVFPIVILIMFLIKRYSFAQIAKISLVVTAIFCAVMSPWWIRNYIVFDRFIPLTISSGMPMLEGSVIWQVGSENDVEELIIFWRERIADMGRDEIARDSKELLEAQENIKNSFRDDFGKALRWHTLDKMYIQWRHAWISTAFTDFNDRIKNTFTAAQYEHVLILVFAVVGAIFMLATKANRVNRVYLLLIILYFNFIHLPFIPIPRYMLPIMPLVIVFSCYGGVRVYSWMQLKKDVI